MAPAKPNTEQVYFYKMMAEMAEAADNGFYEWEQLARIMKPVVRQASRAPNRLAAAPAHVRSAS